MAIWEINIYCENSPGYSILGEEDVFKAELIAWREYCQRDIQGATEAQASFSDNYIDIEGFEVRTIKGFSHDIGRFPATVAYRFNEVVGITVVRAR